MFCNTSWNLDSVESALDSSNLNTNGGYSAEVV